MDVASIVGSLLSLVAQVAPGVMAAITGQRSDAEALEHAEQAAKRLHPHRAASAIDRVAAELGRRDTPLPPVLDLDARLETGG